VETGLSKSSVQAALRRLGKRGLLTSKRASPTAIPLYLVQAPWRGR
jgi:DNA-binding GntR family transcriptional regulator